MPREIKLGPASLNDIEDLFSLEQKSFSRDVFSRNQLRYHVKSSTGNVILAKAGKQTVGYILLLKRANSRKMRIHSLAVDPSWRKRGVAGSLLEYASLTASRSGKTMLILDVREANRQAINLYKRHGFTIIGKKMYHYSDGCHASVMEHCL